MSRAYYNEIDKYAAAWLSNLIAEGLIPSGHVDTRSIVDVRPADLEGFVHRHALTVGGDVRRAGVGPQFRVPLLEQPGDDASEPLEPLVRG